MAGLRCAIFDLDGTLFDSSSLWEDIDREFLRERGIAMPDGYVDALNSMGFREAAEYTKELFSLEESPEELLAIWNGMARAAYMDSIPLKEGAGDYVGKLHGDGAIIAAATDLSLDLADGCLRRNGILSCFSFISTTEGCGRDKSHPDVYLAVSERFGLRPDECLVYEDILRGIRTAGKAGFRTAAVYDSASAADWEAMMAAADIALGSFLS